MAISFKRDISTFISDFFAEKRDLNSRVYNTEIAVEIVLQDETVLTYASASLTIDSLSQGTSSVSITPIVFAPRIENRPQFKHTQTRPVDSGTIDIVNLDFLISEMIPSEDRLFDNATITAYLCFPKTGGNYEGLIYFVGKLADLTGDDESATISPVSDVGAKIATLGKEITQRCQNELGDSWCSVGFLPVGAECSKIYADREGGCLYWGGVFNGVPYVNPSNQIAGYSGPIEPPWQPGDGPPCPAPESWFRRPNGQWTQGFDLKIGDIILWHETEVEITAAEIVWAEYRYQFKSLYRVGLIHSASHRFLVGLDDDVGKPAHVIFPNRFPLILRTPELGRKLIDPFIDDLGQEPSYCLTPTTAGNVLRLSTTFPHKYDVGAEPEYTVESHNTKQYQYNPV